MRPLDVLKAIDGGARLWVGRECRDVTALARQSYRTEVARLGADPAAAAARVIDEVLARAIQKPNS